MKQRVLVMNGQRLVQSEQGGQWSTDKVEKAGALKPGFYNIHLANQADKSEVHTGVIVHADKHHVYQQVGKSFVKHERTDFDKVPDLGDNSSIRYNESRAVVSAPILKLGRSIG